MHTDCSKVSSVWIIINYSLKKEPSFLADPGPSKHQNSSLDTFSGLTFDLQFLETGHTSVNEWHTP